MEYNSANEIVNQYLNRIFGFVKKRVANESDVEDITQEISIKLYKALCVKEVSNVEGFVWTVARNTLANFYRDSSRIKMNISIEENELDIEDKSGNMLEHMIERENYHRIRKEIAYLSKIQRQVLIMYYYEEKKQSEIASVLNIPLGTVKWHLNVAKDELKKGMRKMRNIRDLKFNPIEFSQVGFSGGTGSMGNPNKFVRSALSQNIIYCIKDEYRTVEEIADTLNVSPVYVESEIEFLENYQLVLKDKSKYISNIVIEEMNDYAELEFMQTAYSTIAEKITSKLYDEIIKNNYQNSPDILGPKDDNFRMWALMLYLIATSDTDCIEKPITFEQAATIRADGGHNIIIAAVDSEVGRKSLEVLEGHCGPCWNNNGNLTLWLVDGKWSEKRVTEFYGGVNIERDLKLLNRFIKGESLSVDEYTFMLEKGYIVRSNGIYELGVVALLPGETKEKLLSLAHKIKNDILSENMELVHGLMKQMSSTKMPKNVKIQRDFLNQQVFSSDGYLLVFAEEALMNSGRLQEVDACKKKSVGQIVIMN